MDAVLEDMTKKKLEPARPARLTASWIARGHGKSGTTTPTGDYPYFPRPMEKFDISSQIEGYETRSLVARDNQ